MPRYAHFCATCEFLGEHEEYDLYYCPSRNGGTLLVRCSNDPSEYASMMLSVFADHQDFYKANPDYKDGQAFLKAFSQTDGKACD